MLIGQLLVSLGLASQGDIDRALEQQRSSGRRLGEVLVDLGTIASEDLTQVLNSLPLPPRSIEALGIDRSTAQSVLLKASASGLLSSTLGVANELRISNRLANVLIDEAREQQLIEMKPGLTPSDMHFALSGKGRAAADAAFEANAYVGPLPVSLEEYTARVHLQSVRLEIVTPEVVRQVFADMTTSEDRLREIGAAANSSRSALLFGPAGNGKTSIAERMARLFRAFIFVPYCFEVAGQIIRVFDPSVHRTIQKQGEEAVADRSSAVIFSEDYDRRWVPCRRPFVVTGGELTLEMLDLNFNMLARYYEAPLQVKANNGVFLVDDFGRQLVDPRALLNRWIVPMDRRIDYLKLHTGKSFSLPFDGLLLFSSNLVPEDIMDPAFLRRIPHKILVDAPSEEEYRTIFASVLARAQAPVDPDLVDYVIGRIRERGVPIASFQPRFVVDQINDLRRYLGSGEQLPLEVMADFALKNLFGGSTPRTDGEGSGARSPRAGPESMV